MCDLVRVGPPARVLHFMLCLLSLNAQLLETHKDTDKPVDKNIIVAQSLSCCKIQSATIHLKNASDTISRGFFWMYFNPEYPIKVPLPKELSHDYIFDKNLGALIACE